MPLLTVRLDDPADCQRGLQLLQQLVEMTSEDPIRGKGPEKGCGPRHRRGGRHRHREDDDAPNSPPMPLRKKLMAIRQRGVWRHLLAIAQAGDTAKSLPEWDAMLDLPRNKMRSLKAIFAKLENRWDLQLMQVADEAGLDETGNPRYLMPPRIRQQILQVESLSQ